MTTIIHENDEEKKEIVKAVNLNYLIGMKLTSARKQNLRDVTEIINSDDTMQPLELLAILNDMDFTIDISNLFASFEGARGMEWLEQYYMNNENELSKYF